MNAIGSITTDDSVQKLWVTFRSVSQDKSLTQSEAAFSIAVLKHIRQNDPDNHVLLHTGSETLGMQTYEWHTEGRVSEFERLLSDAIRGKHSAYYFIENKIVNTSYGPELHYIVEMHPH